MNYILCFQVTGTGYHSTTYKCPPYFVALFLDFRAAFSFDCPSYATAQNKLGISGVDNGIGLHFGDIGFEEFQNAILDVYFHSVGLLQAEDRKVETCNILKIVLKTKAQNSPKGPLEQAQKLLADLAEIVAVWLELPEHIKAAIKVLVKMTKPEQRSVGGPADEELVLINSVLAFYRTLTLS